MNDPQNRSTRRQRRGRAPVDTASDPHTAGGSSVRQSPPPSIAASAVHEIHGDTALLAEPGDDAAEQAGIAVFDGVVDATAAERGIEAMRTDDSATALDGGGLDAEAVRRPREPGGDAPDIPWHLRPWQGDAAQTSGSGPVPGAGEPGQDGDDDGSGQRSWPPEVEPHHHAWVYAAVALFLLSLAFGGWGLWTVFRPVPLDGGGDLRAQSERLNQEVSTLRRSDQISREANRDLQRTLAERDEEIAGLRADVAFYERFVGATGQRRGLSVHELKLQPERDGAWRFVATLTQNLNRGAINSGRLTVSVEGSREGRLQRLAWSELRQQTAEPGLDYSFKYFQQLEGNLLLPAGFEPLRVSVRLVPEGGSAVEQSFPWADVAAAPRAQDSSQR